MKTFQDFEKTTDTPAFLMEAIREHKSSQLYQTAMDAEAYDHRRNVTILRYVKVLYTLEGIAVPDKFSPNHKMCSNFFHRIVTQATQYLMGNGVTLDKASDKKKLGKTIDNRLQELIYSAFVQGVSFGFWDYDQLYVFKLTEFVPLLDENTGAIRAGIRFWAVDDDKPLNIVLYEEDGVTEYRRPRNGAVTMTRPKRGYKTKTISSKMDGVQVMDDGGYSALPITPMWASKLKQSLLVGMQEDIDCYDLIKSGFANDLNEAALIYWTIKNGQYASDGDLARFVERIKTIKVAPLDAEAHTVDVPYQSRQAYLEILSRDIYRDAQVLDIASLSGAQKTTVEIDATYQPMDNMIDDLEYQVRDFLSHLFAIVGIDAEPSFQRSRIVNQLEETQKVLMAAQYLDRETLLRKLSWLSPEEVDEILDRLEKEDAARFATLPTTTQDPEEPPEPNQEE